MTKGLFGGIARPESPIEKVLFLGKSAATADLAAAERAAEMQAKGVDRDTIWKATGWAFDDRVGQWYFETDDRKFKPTIGKGVQPLREALPHKGLLDAYDTDNVVVEKSPKGEASPFGRLLGQYIGQEYRAPGAKDRIRINDGLSAGPQRATALHELQHFADDADGVSYRRHSGGAYLDHPLERRAYNVEYRRDLSPERRAELPPWQTEAELAQNWKPMQRQAGNPSKIELNGDAGMAYPGGLFSQSQQPRPQGLLAAAPMGGMDPSSAMQPQGGLFAPQTNDPGLEMLKGMAQQLRLSPDMPPGLLMKEIWNASPTDSVGEMLDGLSQRLGIPPPWAEQQNAAQPARQPMGQMPGGGAPNSFGDYVTGRIQGGEQHIGDWDALTANMETRSSPGVEKMYGPAQEAMHNVLRHRYELERQRGGR